MNQHSGEIRIPDLANPQLTPGQRAAIAYGETQRPSLREAEVLEAAQKQSGLSDFGAEDFRPRLRAWLQAARGDSELNALNRMLLHEDCVRILVNRLRLEDLLRRHPEVARARLVVSQSGGRDAMTLSCESATRPAGLEAALAQSLQAVTKLRGEIVLHDPGALPNDGKVIEDARSYD